MHKMRFTTSSGVDVTDDVRQALLRIVRVLRASRDHSEVDSGRLRLIAHNHRCPISIQYTRKQRCAMDMVSCAVRVV